MALADLAIELIYLTRLLELNPADLFTKVLGRQVFERHRRTVLNLPCGEGVEKTRRLRGGGA